jgi:acyl-CoA synthetase (AMP-forming)/AMP-acid ligase II/predicted NAD/FAD-dependent oxidoreductase/acyl carrier protein
MVNSSLIKNETILSKLTLRVQEKPDRRLFTLVDDKGHDQASFTAGQLFRSAVSVAGYLRDDLGACAGDRILLCYPPSLDFVTALFGCLLSGIIPVPVAPPNPLKQGYDRRTFAAIAENSGAVAILTNGQYDQARKLASMRHLFRRGRGWPDLPWHRSDRLPFRQFQDLKGLQAGPDDLALLQYTSGSTAAPKGVMITHGNISHQLWLNGTELGVNESSQAVFWVPHFHDFGLISGILSAVYNNMAVTMMSPLDYLRRPALWFEVMSRVRATHTAAPDFAFRLAVRKTTAEQRGSWDLSSMQVVMSAAEPIQPSTIDAFTRAFFASNLDPKAFCPAYGLAEHTVGVSVFGRNRLHVNRASLERDRLVVLGEQDGPGSVTLIGCGPPSAGVDLRIVDPDTGRESEPDALGEIWVDSPSKAAGYYGQPESSRDLFQAQLAGDDGQGAYLRTGDLGFIAGGELYIAGRLKDMINAYGRNIYPQDLEETLSAAHLSIRPGRTVAFSIPASGTSSAGLPQEEIAVLVEVKAQRLPADQLEEIVQAVRTSILADHQLPLRCIIVLRKGTVMKTTSGKLRRQAHREVLLEGKLAGQALMVAVTDDVFEDEALQNEKPRRVAVIGGGVSGLTAAYELQRLGHQATVFESQSIIGGKIAAVRVDDRVYDIGGQGATDRYHALMLLADELGVEFVTVRGPEIYDLVDKSFSPPDCGLFDPDLRRVYERVRSREFPQILQAGLVHDAERLVIPAADWLQEHGLEGLGTKAMVLNYAAFGYGYLNDPNVPVAHFLKYLEATLRPTEDGYALSKLVTGGMTSLWRRLARTLDDVRCKAEVIRVKRSRSGIQVTTSDETLTFDDIILALPFELAADFLDASDEESALFSRIRYLDYVTILCSVEGLPAGQTFLVRQNCLDPATTGHMVFSFGQYPDTDVFLFGAYGGPSWSEDDIIQYLKEDLAQMGATMTAVHAQQRWRYMPHVTGHDVKDGYYRRFERLQGTNRTFYLGSLLSMETIESNVAYAYELIRRNFKPTGYDVDRRLPYLHLAVKRWPDGINSVDQVRQWLVERLAAGLGISMALIDPSVSLDTLAIDSLRAMQMVSQIEAELGVTLSQDWLLRGLTLDELADQLMRIRRDGQAQPATAISRPSPGAAADIEWEEGAL